ncbi:MG2 domain-containing protein [Pokkaliibacter sp. CJK22405]|uniref:alpha-2-macroglobulin family protein n=1 Tax=Pokkaliibacter sp. CJK22405 TaxID=3384615 RepID=UPI003984B5C4
MKGLGRALRKRWMPGLVALTLVMISTPLVAADDESGSTAEQAATAAVEPAKAAGPVATAAVSAEQNFRVLDIGQGTWKGSLAASIVLSSPVDMKQDLSEWLNLVRKDGERVEGGWIADDTGKRLYFPYLQPDTTYQITVREGLPGADGSELKIENRVRAILRQDITTPAMPKVLSFADSGHMLAHKLTKGLPITAVNVDDVEIDFYRLNSDAIADFLISYGNDSQLYVWGLERTLERAERVYTGRYDLKLPANTRGTRYIPIKSNPKFAEQGIYLAILREVGSYGEKFTATWFAVTDLGVQLSIFPKEVTAQVTSLSTAMPVGNVSLEMLDNDNHLLGRKETDAQGLAKLGSSDAILKKAALLIARHGADTTLIRLQGPELDLSEFSTDGRPNEAQSLFIYSPRDLYRPGETLTLTALLRDQDGKSVPAVPLQAELRQPNGRVVRSLRLAPQTAGFYEQNFPLAKDAPTGTWQFVVTLPDKSQEAYNVQVEDFLPERMSLQLSAPKVVLPEEKLEVAIEGSYLYGAPAANNRVQTRLVVKPQPHPFENFKTTFFGNVKDERLVRNQELDDLSLDEEGKASLTPEPFWQKAESTYELRFYENLLDSGGRPVARRKSVQVVPASTLVGIRPLFKDDQVDSNSTAGFELVATNGTDLQARAGLKAELIREERDYHWQWSEQEGWKSSYTVREYAVNQWSLDIAAGSPAKLEAPVEWGGYRLEVTDPQTGLKTAYRFEAGWQSEQTALAGRPDRIGLGLNQQSFNAGDEMVVDIQPPAAGKGFLTLVSDKVLMRRWVEIPAEGAREHITLDPAWANRHDLYLSLTLVQPGDSQDEKLPRRMMGITPVALNREGRRLAVAIDVPEKIEPNTHLDVPVTVTLPQDTDTESATPVHVTLAAVDEGILSISGFKTPDPFGWLFAQRRYSAEHRDSFDDLIEGGEGELAQLRYGGDADLNRGGSEPPSDVQIISLYSGLVTVDEAGKAVISLDIPEFNGKLRLMAVAFSEQDFGSAEKALTVAAPVVAQISKPRFLAMGDKSSVSVDLNNLSGKAQTLQVQLGTDKDDERFALELGKARVSGIDAVDATQWAEDKPLALTVGVNQKAIIRVPLTAGVGEGLVPLRLRVTGIKRPDESQPEASIEQDTSIRLRPAWAEQHQQWQQSLEAGESFSLPTDAVGALISSTVIANVSLSSLPPLVIADYFSTLKAYPYGCLEQTTSGVFPQLYLNDELLTQLHLDGSTSEKRNAALTLAIQRLSGMQRSNGGFGLWSSDSMEEFWLTAYVTDFLQRASVAGYPVPESTLTAAVKRLQEYVRNPEWIDAYYREDPAASRASVVAYAGLILARMHQAPLASLRTYFDQLPASAPGLAKLQLGLALELAGDRTRGLQGQQSGEVALLGETTHNYADYGSRTRDLALAAFWLMEQEKPRDEWLPVVMELQKSLQEERWLSTQERNSLFLVGQALRQQQGDTMTLVMGDAADAQENTLSLANFDSRLQGADAAAHFKVRNAGEEAVYLDARLTGYSQQAPAPVDHGLSVTRSYLLPETGDVIALQEGTDNLQLFSGELVLVRLQVKASDARHHILVQDLLPAGLELENQNLANSTAMEDVKVDDHSVQETMAYQDIRHQEFRDDRYAAAIEMPEGVATLYYLARAVTAGTYTIPGTSAEVMYQPDIRHVGKATTLVVTPR